MAIHAFKTISMCGQAHINNFQNPQNMVLGVCPLSPEIDKKWSNSIKMAILQHDNELQKARLSELPLFLKNGLQTFKIEICEKSTPYPKNTMRLSENFQFWSDFDLKTAAKHPNIGIYENSLKIKSNP